MPEQETAVTEILHEGEWLDYARTTPERALRWIDADPTRRRARDWISRKPIAHDAAHPSDGTVARVDSLPSCDFCKMNMDHPTAAAYDGTTTSGQWAYMCDAHFAAHGPGRLGLGIAQRLLVTA
jgi:hypothetical protein